MKSKKVLRKSLAVLMAIVLILGASPFGALVGLGNSSVFKTEASAAEPSKPLDGDDEEVKPNAPDLPLPGGSGSYEPLDGDDEEIDDDVEDLATPGYPVVNRPQFDELSFTRRNNVKAPIGIEYEKTNTLVTSAKFIDDTLKVDNTLKLAKVKAQH